MNKLVVIKSNRKSISLSINDNLDAVIRAPYAVDEGEIKNFVQTNKGWIEQATVRKQKQLDRLNVTDEEIERLKSLAKEIIPERVEYFSKIMGLTPTGIKITSAKKRFGSCNSKNSLCFSYYLMAYPPEAIDYVVVHELAHIRHHNHSREFYSLIEQYMPDYKSREKLLR